MRRSARTTALLMVLAASLFLCGGVSACPNCSAAQPAEGGKVVGAEALSGFSRGVNISIFFMIGSIYGVFAFGVFILRRAYTNYQPGMVAGGVLMPVAAGAVGAPMADVQPRKEPGA